MKGLVSVATAALVATVAGVGGTLPIVLAAAQAVGATPEQASSWVSGLGIATALSALVLSLRYRMPIITAWSTPGAALIASTVGINFSAAVGAFVLSAVLILLTATVRPLGRLIVRIPASIASAMLAGILLRLVVAMVEFVPAAPVLDVAQALEHPHTAHREMVVTLDQYQGLGAPVKLGRTPASYRFAPLSEGRDFLPDAGA